MSKCVLSLKETRTFSQPAYMWNYVALGKKNMLVVRWGYGGYKWVGDGGSFKKTPSLYCWKLRRKLRCFSAGIPLYGETRRATIHAEYTPSHKKHTYPQHRISAEPWSTAASGSSGGRVCPSAFPNQQGTRSVWSNVLKPPPPLPGAPAPSPAPDAFVFYGWVPSNLRYLKWFFPFWDACFRSLFMGTINAQNSLDE